ncbi:MAG: hypothetical protein IJN74_05090 [Clostridia bacterium]|nr:hypothetical protein [Clostridia bacterium]
MERKKVRAVRHSAKKESTSPPSGGKLVLRIFFSVLLILAAIFIKQNSPSLADMGREALSAWTVSLPSF